MLSERAPAWAFGGPARALRCARCAVASHEPPRPDREHSRRQPLRRQTAGCKPGPHRPGPDAGGVPPSHSCHPLPSSDSRSARPSRPVKIPPRSMRMIFCRWSLLRTRKRADTNCPPLEGVGCARSRAGMQRSAPAHAVVPSPIARPVAGPSKAPATTRRAAPCRLSCVPEPWCPPDRAQRSCAARNANRRCISVPTTTRSPANATLLRISRRTSSWAGGSAVDVVLAAKRTG
jgi:hypothetical protein